jgi:ABC-2 type transport system permease protein
MVVLVRDLERVVRIVLRLGFYATPVIFAVSDVPGRLSAVFALNPLAGVIELNRAGFSTEPVQWSLVGISVSAAAVLLAAGWAVFARLERTVLKEI